MGIRLDWESDSARSGNKDGRYVAREDPSHKRARARARTRFIITLIAITMLLGGIGVARQLEQIPDDDRIGLAVQAVGIDRTGGAGFVT